MLLLANSLLELFTPNTILIHSKNIFPLPLQDFSVSQKRARGNLKFGVCNCLSTHLPLNGAILELQSDSKDKSHTVHPPHGNSAISEFLPSQDITVLQGKNLILRKGSQFLRQETTLIANDSPELQTKLEWLLRSSKLEVSVQRNEKNLRLLTIQYYVWRILRHAKNTNSAIAATAI